MPTHILEWSPSQLRKNTHLPTNADGGAGGVGGDGHGVADMKAVDPRRLWPAHVPTQVVTDGHGGPTGSSYRRDHMQIQQCTHLSILLTLRTNSAYRLRSSSVYVLLLTINETQARQLISPSTRNKQSPAVAAGTCDAQAVASL